LERRCSLEELSRLVSVLIQSERRGLALGPVLKEMGRNQRALRSLRMKKLAAEAPLKMLLPLMAFILPVVFIVLFGPIVLRWQAGGF
jgi:tight adherence protein C